MTDGEKSGSTVLLLGPSDLILLALALYVLVIVVPSRLRRLFSSWEGKQE
jgi:hypothetical protein